MYKLKLYLFLLLTFVISFSAADTAKPRILVMGDSLSAGYGIKLEQGWVSLLQQEKMLENHWTLINASVSGETSTGGLERLPALLQKHQPEFIILELGGNDGLRGYPLKILRKNLQQMIRLSQATGAKVILAGMQIPPNYGPRYTREFKQLYAELANENSIALIPFLLQGIPEKQDWMQNDGIHPTAEAQTTIVNNVLPVLTPLLEHASEN